MPLNKRRVGKWGEAFAVEFLEKNGIEILEKNYRIREGEVDIIARDPQTEEIIFVEVKSRRDTRYGLPQEAVNEKKQENIRKVAVCYLSHQGWMERDIRFDVISLIGKKNINLQWIRRAF